MLAHIATDLAYMPIQSKKLPEQCHQCWLHSFFLLSLILASFSNPSAESCVFEASSSPEMGTAALASNLKFNRKQHTTKQRVIFIIVVCYLGSKEKVKKKLKNKNGEKVQFETVPM